MESIRPRAELTNAPLQEVACPDTYESIVERPNATQRFIEQQGRFHSEKDREIALNFAGRLRGGVIAQWLTPEAYTEASDALKALIPVDNGNGKRQIDGKTIPPAIEERIASRLLSTEIDIAGPQGSWGRLPETVKQYTTYYAGNMTMELATHCTVGCNFCAFANKGPIAAKASFDSAIAVMRDFTDRQFVSPMQPRIDNFFWGSDPFDAKWAATGTAPERDYSDLVRAYYQLPNVSQRQIFTSTAVPVGEELRILNFFDVSMKSGIRGPMRLSKTHVNSRRVEHITTLLKMLNPRTFHKVVVNEVLTTVDISLRGSRWDRPLERDYDLWDIMGPNCRDGVVLGVTSVDGIIMQGGSNERPSGETRTPIETATNGTRIFTLPRPQYSPPLSGRTVTSNIYPDARVDIIEINTGRETIVEREIKDDPHRALLRVAGAFTHYLAPGYAKDRAAAVQEFRENFGDSVTLLQAYLASGANNVVIGPLLKGLAREGFIQ